MAVHLVAILVINLWQIANARAPEAVATDCTDQKSEELLRISGYESIPASGTVYAAPEEVQNMIEAVLTAHKPDML